MDKQKHFEFSRYRQYYQAISSVAQQPKTRVYTTPIFSFLAVSLFGLYAILPTVRTILFLQREIEDKTKANAQMEEKISALIESQAAFEAANEKIPLVSEAIPQTAKPVDLTISIRNLAAATAASLSGVQVSSVPLVAGVATPSASRQSDTPSTVNFSVVASGSYSNLKSFLNGLLSLKRIVTIDTIHFLPSSEETSATRSGSILQLSLQLKAYYQNP